MTAPSERSGNRVLFLTPEAPSLGSGGGALRSASLLEYLHQKYDVQIASLTLPHHSKSFAARAWRNSIRFARGRPPLFDRYSGFDEQIRGQMRGRYRFALVEHFWCASYAAVLRPHSDQLILDLHNVESALAWSHSRATSGLESAFFRRFARAYERLEKDLLPQFDMILVTSEQDRQRISHPRVVVYPNALPQRDIPEAPEAERIVFSGNMEYHPNVEAVRWFRREIWPQLRAEFPQLEWWLVGRNEQAIRALIAGDERIHATGPVNDADAILATARICVVPLLSGSGTRFKILEAWAAKRPVVSTSIGAEGLDAVPGEHLLIGDTASGFVDAVRDALRSPSLRLQLGQRGHQWYLSRYTWRAAWKSLEAAGL